MASRKYYERLLVVAGIFLIFFVISMLSLPLLLQVLKIDPSSRQGLLLIAVYQAVVMFICSSLLSARLNSSTPSSYLCLNQPPSVLGLLGVVFAYLIALPFLNQIIYWNSNIYFPESLEYWEQIFREMEDSAVAASEKMLDVASVSGLIVNLLVIALLTAFGEELFFRGTLQTTASSSGAYHTSIWVVALLFSAMHFQVYGFVPRLLLGAWFGYLLYWTGSIYVPIFAHFLNNGVVVLCTWFTYRGFDFNIDNFGVVETGFPMPAFISALAFVIFIVFFRNFFFSRIPKTIEYV